MKAKPFSDQAWDICADFFEPLAKMLVEWGCERLDVDGFTDWPAGMHYPGPVPTTKAKSETDCALLFVEVANPRIVQLADIWLRVNVSMELADHVMKLIGQIGETVFNDEAAGHWPNTLGAGGYLRDLARVLRQRQGKPISKNELEAERKQEADDFRGPFTVAELTNGKRKGGAYRKGLLGITRSTLYARKKKEPGMFREGIGGLFVHKSLLPNR